MSILRAAARQPGVQWDDVKTLLYGAPRSRLFPTASVGGMSVDPDDKTPEGIRRSGAIVETHGFPILPGSMFLMAYLGETPVMGLSGCVLHDPFTAFDALLPRLIAGEKITRADIMAMGHGGLAKKHDH